MKSADDIKIGGEFELDPSVLSGYKNNLAVQPFLYSSGRIALLAILEQIKKNNPPVIHIPFYICHSVISICKKAGFIIKYYEVDENFLLQIEYINNIKRSETLLSLNYFGFTSDNLSILQIKALRPDILIISDHVQSYWTFNETVSDYAFTSLRKVLPMPDGALVYAKNKDVYFNQHLKEAAFYKNKLIGALLKFSRTPEDIFLDFFKKGEDEIDNDVCVSKASVVSHYLYSITDFEYIKMRRQENCKLVYELGEANGINFVFGYNESVVPLNIPIILKDRNEVRKQLMTSNIFLPVYWPRNSANNTSPLSERMADNALSLVIDQRYSSEEIHKEMHYLIKAVRP